MCAANELLAPPGVSTTFRSLSQPLLLSPVTMNDRSFAIMRRGSPPLLASPLWQQANSRLSIRDPACQDVCAVRSSRAERSRSEDTPSSFFSALTTAAFSSFFAVAPAASSAALPAFPDSTFTSNTTSASAGEPAAQTAVGACRAELAAESLDRFRSDSRTILRDRVPRGLGDSYGALHRAICWANCHLPSSQQRRRTFSGRHFTWGPTVAERIGARTRLCVSRAVPLLSSSA